MTYDNWILPPEPSAREQMLVDALNDAKDLYLYNIQLLECGWRLPNDDFEGRLKSLVETINEILDMLNRAEDVATGRDCEE